MNTMTLSYVFGDDWTTVPIKPKNGTLGYVSLGEWQFDETNGVSEDPEYMDDRFEKVMQKLKEHDYEIDYRFLSEKHKKALLEYKEDKNREMFERWDKIRQKMASYQIHIGVIHSDDQEELGIERDDLYITKSLDKNGENYFEWLVTFKNGEVYDNDGGSYKYEEVIRLDADIEWINTEMLENLEELYDIE